MTDDKDLIAEVRRRGYKVYPEKRVRIYSSQEMVDRRTVEQLRSLQGFMDHTAHHLALGIGKALQEGGVLVRSREDRVDGAIYRAQVCVVLPNDWDFEAEMWGMRR